MLVTSPRLPADQLTREAWRLVEGADVVLAPPGAGGVASAARAAGVPVVDVVDDPLAALAEAEADAGASGGDVVWLADPGRWEDALTPAAGSPDPLLALRDAAGAVPGLGAVRVVVGNVDPPGAHLLDAVALMDRLRSPGGCPWDADQTHASLTRYLLEEAHEVVEVVEAGGPQARRRGGELPDELGDVLLQVLFHARIGAERPDGFDVDDVADALVAKLVRRHPHVFAGAQAGDAASLEASWDALKAAEGRSSVTSGVATGQPALPLAAKLLSRASRAGLLSPGLLDAAEAGHRAAVDEERAAEVALAGRLLEVLADARRDGVDAETALRTRARALAAALVAAEQAHGA